MKRTISIFSAFLLLVGCVKNEPTGSAGASYEKEIVFDCPVLAPKTKSVYEVNSYPDATNFKVWAYYSTTGYPTVDGENLNTIYMDAVEVSKQGDVWKAANGGMYYWPNNGGLTFIAHAPASPVGLTSGTSDVTSSGLQITGYEVPPTADEDLFISQIEYNKTYQGTSSVINFTHALTSLTFNMKSGIYGDRTIDDPDRLDTDIRVTKIEVVDARSTGNFNQSMTTWEDEQMTDDEYGWTPEDSPLVTYAAYDKTSDVTDAVVLTGTLASIHDKEAPDAGYSLTNLILLPQEILDTVKLKVTFDMTHNKILEGNQAAVDAGYNYGNNRLWVTGQTIEVSMNDLGGITEWERGKRYVYNITMYLDKIVCSSEIVGWETEETVMSDIEDMIIYDVNL